MCIFVFMQREKTNPAYAHTALFFPDFYWNPCKQKIKHLITFQSYFKIIHKTKKQVKDRTQKISDVSGVGVEHNPGRSSVVTPADDQSSCDALKKGFLETESSSFAPNKPTEQNVSTVPPEHRRCGGHDGRRCQ